MSRASATISRTMSPAGWMAVTIPKGFFPQQDTGQITGGIRADQSISFQAMQDKLRTLVNIIRRDPAVDTVVGFAGGRAGGGSVAVHDGLGRGRRAAAKRRLVSGQLLPAVLLGVGRPDSERVLGRLLLVRDDGGVHLDDERLLLVGEVVRYQDVYRLCYIRGPEGILIGLAQELTR